MNNTLNVLDRNKSVTILYRGKSMNLIIPVTQKFSSKKMKKHAFFGLHKNIRDSIVKIMANLRISRY